MTLILFSTLNSGYCQHIDTHVPTNTVREALLFSAMMRQPESVPLAEKEAWFVPLHFENTSLMPSLSVWIHT